MIPKNLLGKTGIEVSRIGLGGEGVLRTTGRQKEARAVIEKAMELGVNYLESASAYSESESYYGLALGKRRGEIILASKSHDRTAEGATAHLESSLAALRTDWLDLWQIHDVRNASDLERIFGPGGAIEAFDRAKREGKVRFVGITGHQAPEILLQAFELYDFDTVLMPVNPAEPSYRSFIDTVLPEARGRKMGVIGMKVLCRGLALGLPGYESPAPWVRYALGQDLSTMVIGCETPEQVEENVAVAREALPMDEEERQELEGVVAPYARKLMYYK